MELILNIGYCELSAADVLAFGLSYPPLRGATSLFHLLVFSIFTLFIFFVISSTFVIVVF
jgi:hypothetical protein